MTALSAHCLFTQATMETSSFSTTLISLLLSSTQFEELNMEMLKVRLLKAELQERTDPLESIGKYISECSHPFACLFNSFLRSSSLIEW